MSLHGTVLHGVTAPLVPNSQITIVTIQTRDWAQVPRRVTVAAMNRATVCLSRQLSEGVRHDPVFARDIGSDIQVPGWERIASRAIRFRTLNRVTCTSGTKLRAG